MRPSERFKHLADSTHDPKAKGLFMQQYFRAHVQEQIGDCRRCHACNLVNGQRIQLAKTPAFMSFVSVTPMSLEWKSWVANGLGMIGHGMDDVGFFAQVSCPVERADSEAIGACRPNYQALQALHSSRILVLLGDAASSVFMDRVDLKQAHGTWTESVNGKNRVYYFLTYDPRDGAPQRESFLADLPALGSLFHYAWTVFMGELYPGSQFVSQLSYEQICDVVANDLKRVLMSIPEGRRINEFMQLMSRILADSRAGEGMAVRALYDDEFMRKCGISKDMIDQVVRGGSNEQP